MSGSFFVGYDPARSSAGFASRVAFVVIAILAGLGTLFAARQQTVRDATFEFGRVRAFRGVLLADPVPILVAEERDEASDAAVFLLTNPFKYGFEIGELEMKRVEIHGTAIYDSDGQAMIEVVSDPAPKMLADTVDENPLGEPTSLGDVALSGEIVDSKCYFGVMNPGASAPHRACAVHCIRGGVPPVLLMRRSDGSAQYVLLVGRDGEAIGEQLLDRVAEPVEVRGELLRMGPVDVLRMSPGDVRRL